MLPVTTAGRPSLQTPASRNRTTIPSIALEPKVAEPQIPARQNILGTSFDHVFACCAENESQSIGRDRDTRVATEVSTVHSPSGHTGVADIQLRDALDLFGKQTSIINSLWQNYSAVTGVLIALGISGVKAPLSLTAQLAATVAFSMFSYGNWVLIRQGSTVQTAVKDAIATTLSTGSDLTVSYRHVLVTLTSTANSARVSSLYHFSIDAAVFAALWLPSLR